MDSDCDSPPPPHLIGGPSGGDAEKDGGFETNKLLQRRLLVNQLVQQLEDEGSKEDDIERVHARGTLVVGTHPPLPTTQESTLSSCHDNRHVECRNAPERQAAANSHSTDSLNERVVSFDVLQISLAESQSKGHAIQKKVANNKRERRHSPSGTRRQDWNQLSSNLELDLLTANSAQIPRQVNDVTPTSQAASQVAGSVTSTGNALSRKVSDMMYKYPQYGGLGSKERKDIRDKGEDENDTEHPNTASRVDMRRHDVRMATFQNNSIKWLTRVMSADRLARVGFYYMGIEDRVRCFSCGVELEEWGEEGTPEPLLRHYLASQHCSFLQQDFHDKLPELKEQSNTQHSKYANTSLRLHSFAQWPYSDVVTSYQLASVGFFYTGEGSRVICFSCGLIVKEWKRGDVPLLVHCHKNPDCPFISSIIKKGPPAPVQAPQPLLKTLAAPDPSTATNRPNFADLETRLKSFKKLSPAFPISRRDLAEAGLYLLRLPDVMKCHSCGSVLQGWVEGDTAVEKHRAAAADCQFLSEKFPCKLDYDTTLDFDPSSLPAAQFDENELESMAQELSSPTNTLTQTSTHSLPMAALSLSDVPSPQPHFLQSQPHTLPSHLPSYPTYSHSSLANSQPSSLTASSPTSPTEPQPLSLSASLRPTVPSLPPSQHGSSGFISGGFSSAATPYASSETSYSGTGTQSSGYQSAVYSNRSSAGYNSGATPYPTPTSEYPYSIPPSSVVSSSLSVGEVGGKSVSLPPSYSQPGHSTQAVASNQPSSLPSGAECVVCMDRPLEMVFVPCGHVCVCEICSSQITRCPMCRTRTQMAVKIYFPY